MSALLSSEWFDDATAALQEAASSADPVGTPDAAAEVEMVVTGGDPDTVATRWLVEGGRLVAVRTGRDGDDPAGATIPIRAEHLGAVVAGELDPAVAFMRGDLKPEGSAAAVLALLSALAQPSCRAALARSISS